MRTLSEYRNLESCRESSRRGLFDVTGTESPRPILSNTPVKFGVCKISPSSLRMCL